jgi:hypothetical protein
MPLEGEDANDYGEGGWHPRRQRRLRVAHGKSQLDSAEAWLKLNDPDYATRSKAWKHIRRGGGAYRTPREGEVLLAPVADHADQDAPLTIASDAEQYEEPQLITREERMIERVNREVEPTKWLPNQAAPIGTSRAERYAEIEQVIRWDLAHPERFEQARGRRFTLAAVAEAHNVSRKYVHEILRRMKMDRTQFPRLIETVTDHEARIADLEHQVGLPVGGDRAAEAAVERLIHSATERPDEVRVIRPDGTAEILPQSHFDARNQKSRSAR